MYIIENDLKNKNIAVALSGGSDSMALTHYLLKNKDRLSIQLSCINIEHGIRGEESLKDSMFVKEYCNKHNIPFFYYRVNALKFAKQNSYTLEQAARMLRYECFNNAAAENNLDYVLTAHHKNDNIETILFNLLRGSSLKGVSGISYKNGKILRPLIETPKEEIDSYIIENNIEYVTDNSNFDTTYTRNYIRRELIPKLKEKFNGLDSVVRFSKLCKIDDEYLEKNAKALILQIDKKEVKIALSQEKALFFRAVVMSLNFLGVTKDYSFVEIESVYNLMVKQNGCTIDVCQNIKAVKDYNKITLYINNSGLNNNGLTNNALSNSGLNKDELKEEIPFKIGQSCFGDDTICVFEDKPLKENKFTIDANAFLKNKNAKILKFDLEKLPKDAVFRHRKDGDIFKKFGSGSKKLKEYFIDLKIEKRYRDQILLVAKDNIVYIVADYEISDIIKVDKNSKLIYNIAITKGEQ